jgi:multiple sugar transport system permease protein
MRGKHKRTLVHRGPGRMLAYGALSILALTNFCILYWAVLTAFKEPGDILRSPPVLFTTNLTLANFQSLFTQSRFDLYYLNSAIQVSLAVPGILFFASLGGFIFSKLHFRGKELLFRALLATMMIPFAVVMVPMVVIAGKLGLVNSLPSLVVPFLVSPYAIYLMRQYMETIPNDLLDAARMDGASTWQIYSRVMIPLSGPALSTLAIFYFLWNWNSFVWPYIVLFDPIRWTLPVAAAKYTSQYYTLYGSSIAAATFMAAPLMLVFIVFQRGIVKGIALTGMN